MGILTKIAKEIVCGGHGATMEDRIEAYQFLSDNWMIDELNAFQQTEFNALVEGGQIKTAPWRKEA